MDDRDAVRARLAEIAEARADEDDAVLAEAALERAHPDRHGGHRELLDEVERLWGQLRET